MAMFQVQMVSGQKALVPISGDINRIDVVVVSTTQDISPAKDTRLIVDTANITATLNYGGANGNVVEVFAMEACTITYYTGENTTTSLSMAAGTNAVFVYFNGWKYNGIYGAVWN